MSRLASDGARWPANRPPETRPPRYELHRAILDAAIEAVDRGVLTPKLRSAVRALHDRDAANELHRDASKMVSRAFRPGMNVEDVQRATGLHPQVVARWLRELGLYVKPKRQRRLTGEALAIRCFDLHQTGSTNEEIAAELNLKPRSVRRLVANGAAHLRGRLYFVDVAIGAGLKPVAPETRDVLLDRWFTYVQGSDEPLELIVR